MRKRYVVVAVGGLLLLALAAGGVAIAGGESEESVTGPEAGRAVAAALKTTGGGRATGVEREGATWEVEVVTPSGGTVDVSLDERFRPLGVEGDDELVDDAEDADEVGEAPDDE